VVCARKAEISIALLLKRSRAFKRKQATKISVKRQYKRKEDALMRCPLTEESSSFPKPAYIRQCSEQSSPIRRTVTQSGSQGKHNVDYRSRMRTENCGSKSWF
jgi:hypothetical protein